MKDSRRRRSASYSSRSPSYVKEEKKMVAAPVVKAKDPGDFSNF
jgi:hypothetical protein